MPEPDGATTLARGRGTSSTAGRRLGTATVDQAIAGASNMLAAVLLARQLGIEAFGLFAIAFLVYVSAQVVARALVGEPLLVHPEEVEDRPGEVLGTGLVTGCALAAVVLGGGGLAFLWDPRLGNALLVLGLCMPLLVVQDIGRFIALAVHRPGDALVLDSTWLALMIGAIGALAIAGVESLGWYTFAWAGSGAMAGAIPLVRYRRARIRPGLAWMRGTWSFSWRYLVSVGAGQSAVLIGSLALGAISGAVAIAAVRGVLIMVSPFTTIQAASVAAGVSEISRLRPVEHGAIRAHVRRTTAFTTAMAIGNAAVLLALPDGIGRMVLGDTWDVARLLVVPTAIQILMIGMVSGVRAGLFGLRAVRRTVVLEVVGSTLLFVAMITGALVDDALGAAWGVAGAQALVTVLWWRTFRAQIQASGVPASPGMDAPSGAGSP